MYCKLPLIPVLRSSAPKRGQFCFWKGRISFPCQRLAAMPECTQSDFWWCSVNVSKDDAGTFTGKKLAVGIAAGAFLTTMDFLYGGELWWPLPERSSFSQTYWHQNQRHHVGSLLLRNSSIQTFSKYQGKQACSFYGCVCICRRSGVCRPQNHTATDTRGNGLGSKGGIFPGWVMNFSYVWLSLGSFSCTRAAPCLISVLIWNVCDPGLAPYTQF